MEDKKTRQREKAFKFGERYGTVTTIVGGGGAGKSQVMQNLAAQAANSAVGTGPAPELPINDGLGTIYADCGDYEVPETELVETAWRGTAMEVPNAVANSYDKFFRLCGGEDVKVVDWTSSAGDWVLAVKKDGLWYAGFQYNRWPRCGFSYSINVEEPYESFEQLCQPESEEY